MLSVSQLNEQAKALLETQIGQIEVVGEISRLTRHASGHWYFTLKDENASVSAAMFRLANSKVSFDARDGVRVVASAKVSMYVQSGSYQLIVSGLRLDGQGEMELALKELKRRLSLEGLFEASRKKPIAKLPKSIAIVTSATSAALADMLRVASGKWGLSKIYIFDSLTQGDQAPQALIKALKKADSWGCDTIILARGGGSKEDLWCFNDESLARCIASLKTPLITGIGHEIDESVADLVADLKKPTPTAAMMAALPDVEALVQYIDRLGDELNASLKLKLAKSESNLSSLMARFMPQAIKSRLELKAKDIISLKSSLNLALEKKLLSLQASTAKIRASFEAYESFLASTADLVELRQNGKKISLDELRLGDEFSIISQSGAKLAKIIKEA